MIAVVLFDIAYYLASQNQTLNKKLDKLLLPPFTLTVLSGVSWVAYFAVGYFS
jgi:hypothetical protein